ncbi:uncharacterized protein [Watersipora subatra]|uniref:uncharacterized protein isoform X2 n=1 Tax=Watersipora subatra TaxID=2589382 RepID=UPI00355B1E0E
MSQRTWLVLDLFRMFATFAVLIVFVTFMVTFCQSDSPNIICSDERDKSFVNVYSGVISDEEKKEERDCKMRLTVPGTVRVEIYVNSLHFSSRDCTEEYFTIRDPFGSIVPNTTLCAGTPAGTVVVYYFSASAQTGSHVTFHLKMDKDGDFPRDLQSYIDLSFSITDASAYTQVVTTAASAAANGVAVTQGSSGTSTTNKFLPAAIITPKPTLAGYTTPTIISSSWAPENPARGAVTPTDEPIRTSRATTTAPDLNRGGSIDDDGWRMDSKILGISIGLVSTVLVVVLVVVIVLLVRPSSQKPCRSNSSCSNAERASGISPKEINVHAISRRVQRAVPDPHADYSSLFRHSVPARSGPVYYSEIAEGNGHRATIATGFKHPATNISQTINGRRQTERLLEADLLNSNNYHRLESLAEGLASRRGQLTGMSVNFGGGSARINKLSFDSRTGEDYADLSHVKYTDTPYSQDCQQEKERKGSRIENNNVVGSNEDQFGYVVVLPALLSEETEDKSPDHHLSKPVEESDVCGCTDSQTSCE